MAVGISLALITSRVRDHFFAFPAHGGIREPMRHFNLLLGKLPLWLGTVILLAGVAQAKGQVKSAGEDAQASATRAPLVVILEGF